LNQRIKRIGQSFETSELFKKTVFDEGKSYGVIYVSSFSISTNQYYMKCSYSKRKDVEDNDYKCPGKIYATKNKSSEKI